MKHLGSGATADVKLVRDIQTNTQYACKILKSNQNGLIGDATLADLEKELSIVSKIDHPLIIKFHVVGRGPYQVDADSIPVEALFIVMEHAQEGEIFDIIQNTGKFSEPVARQYFFQLLTALNYIHNTVGVCHRDLKLENILLDSNFNIKIADFGFATTLRGPTPSGKLRSYKGTKGYMPPEQHTIKTYGGKDADLFASAVTLFMMVTQCQPFGQAKVTDKFYRLIAANKIHEFWPIFDKVVPLSAELKDLLSGMLQFDPSARYTLEEIFAHPWMQGPVPTPQEFKKEFALRKKSNDIAR